MDFISARMSAEDGWGGREGQPEVPMDGQDGGAKVKKDRLGITRDLEIVTITPKPATSSARPAHRQVKSGSLPALNLSDRELFTLCNGKKQFDGNKFKQEKERTNGPEWSWEDQLLKTLDKPAGKKKRGKTILWRPGSGRHVDEGIDSYRPFTHIIRVLHLQEAVDICLSRRIRPKNVVTFSSLDSRELPPDHPCAKMKVLWFGAKNQEEEEPSNWYGNVEFAVDAQILLTQWKYCFLVEMMTAPTHTASRLLLTNNDYSSVLPRYYNSQSGGPWQVTPKGHKALIQCSRYLFKGTNVHDHALEFMIEATPKDERAILAACQISFKDHQRAKNMDIPHVCNRYQRLGMQCPTPFSASQTAIAFFKSIQQSLRCDRLPVKLSPEAKEQLEFFNEDERRRAMLRNYASQISYQYPINPPNQIYYC